MHFLFLVSNKSNCLSVISRTGMYQKPGQSLVGRAVTRSSLLREVWGSNLGPLKSDTVLSTIRHRCDISLKEAVLPGGNDAEMGPANSLHASVYYSGYNKRFDLIFDKMIQLFDNQLCKTNRSRNWLISEKLMRPLGRTSESRGWGSLF